MKHWSRAAKLIVAVVFSSISIIMGVAPAYASTAYPELVTQNDSGEQANGYLQGAVASDDGNYVAFESYATNLDYRYTLPENTQAQVYIRNRIDKTTHLVSRFDDTNASRNVQLLDISGDGQYVFFYVHEDYGSMVKGVYRYGVANEDIRLVARDATNTGASSYDGQVFFTAVDDIADNRRDAVRIKLADDSRVVIEDGAEAYPFVRLSSDGDLLLYSDMNHGLHLHNIINDSDIVVYQGLAASTPAGVAISNDNRYVFFTTQDIAVTPETVNSCKIEGCSYRVEIATGAIRLIHAKYNGNEIYPRIGTGDISADGEIVIANDDAFGIRGSKVETAMLLVNLGAGVNYPIGYGPNWVPPTRFDQQVSVGLTADASELIFATATDNYGVEPNCFYDVDDDDQPPVYNYCWDILVTSTLQKPTASDGVSPHLANLSFTQNPKSTTDTSLLTVPATDDSSGIARAEYFLGDEDPGQGNGATMTLVNQQYGNNNAVTSADLTTTFGTDFPTGVYKVSVRAQDQAGNWSDPVSDYLVVYDVNGPKFKGKKTIIPSLDNGDILPGLVSPGQDDKATFGFVVKYNNQGQISGNSDLQFAYSTGTHCNNANKADNCHDLSLNATNIAWLTTQGQNSSTGIFQGVADLTVDGQTTTVNFRVTGRDGERMDSTATDQFQLQIFDAGDNPNTATPLYTVNAGDIARGNIKIVD